MTSPSAAVPTAGAVGVLGTGSCLPGNVVTNEEVGTPAGATPEWILQRTGIRARRWAKPDDVTSGLAATAARTALADAGIGVGDLSLVVVATSTPDSPQPPTAAAVAAELGVPPGTPAYDMNAVCSGFVFALTTAERMLHGTGGHALVVGADIYSRILDPADRRTAVLFGDGAGAVVLGPAAGRGVIATRLASFPDHRDLIRVPAGGSRIPASTESLAEGLHYFTMDGRAVRAFVEEHVGPMIDDFLHEHGAPASGEDAPRVHFVPHQANGRMIEKLAADLGFPPERAHATVREYGNTGAASVPVTLDHAASRMARGDLVLLAGFGGGMAAGLALLEWDPPPTCRT